MLTPELLKRLLPYATHSNIIRFTAPLNQTLQLYSINTPLRIAAFIAQVGHESGSLRYVKEIASGEAYEGRLDLGNIYPGDGKRFKGRGLIQTTGRKNYTAVSNALNIDAVTHPELLEQPLYACMSAGFFWGTHDLNRLSDMEQFKQITKIINGGYNGLSERIKLYENCKKVLL